MYIIWSFLFPLAFLSVSYFPFKAFVIVNIGLSVGAAWITGQDRSMWRTLWPSAGQAQQWVSEWVIVNTTLLCSFIKGNYTAVVHSLSACHRLALHNRELHARNDDDDDRYTVSVTLSRQSYAIDRCSVCHLVVDSVCEPDNSRSQLVCCVCRLVVDSVCEPDNSQSQLVCCLSSGRWFCLWAG